MDAAQHACDFCRHCSVLLFTCRGSWSQRDNIILPATPGFDSNTQNLNEEKIKREVISESAF